MSRSLSRQISRLFAVESSQCRRNALRAIRRRGSWVPEGLEPRVMLSGGPTNYTVNSTGSSSSGTGTSGTLPYVIGLADANTNTAGSVIGFDPTVFATAQTITLTSTLVLSEADGPEVIDGPGASLVMVSGGGAVGVFQVGSTATATLSGLTISGGYADGAGIFNQGMLTVTARLLGERHRFATSRCGRRRRSPLYV
jgi:hypothetical protein